MTKKTGKHAAPWTDMAVYMDVTIGRYQRINHTITPTGRRTAS